MTSTPEATGAKEMCRNPIAAHRIMRTVDGGSRFVSKAAPRLSSPAIFVLSYSNVLGRASMRRRRLMTSQGMLVEEEEEAEAERDPAAPPEKLKPAYPPPKSLSEIVTLPVEDRYEATSSWLVVTLSSNRKTTGGGELEEEEEEEDDDDDSDDEEFEFEERMRGGRDVGTGTPFASHIG